MRIESEPCYRAPTGWYCTRIIYHQGACTVKPSWWNLLARVKPHKTRRR